MTIRPGAVTFRRERRRVEAHRAGMERDDGGRSPNQQRQRRSAAPLRLFLPCIFPQSFGHILAHGRLTGRSLRQADNLKCSASHLASDEIKGILGELGTRVTAMQRRLDERISAGVAAVCKHTDERLERLELLMEAKIDSACRSVRGDDKGELWFAGVGAPSGDERQLCRPEGGMGLSAPKMTDDGTGRKRIKERLKEALEVKEVGAAVQSSPGTAEYLFGICEPDRRMGKDGSRCVVNRARDPGVACPSASVRLTRMETVLAD